MIYKDFATQYALILIVLPFESYIIDIVLPLSFKSYTSFRHLTDKSNRNQWCFEIRTKRFVKSTIVKYLWISHIVLIISITTNQLNSFYHAHNIRKISRVIKYKFKTQIQHNHSRYSITYLIKILLCYI